MEYDDFKRAVAAISSPAAAAAQKQASNNVLQRFESDSRNWIVCAQLITETDQYLQFFGYKYAYNILTRHPGMLSAEQYGLVRQRVALNLTAGDEIPAHLFNKQTQVLVQMLFQGLITLQELYSFCVQAMPTSERTCLNMLRLLNRLFSQLNAPLIVAKCLTYRRRRQIQEEVISSVDVSGLVGQLLALVRMDVQAQTIIAALELLGNMVEAYYAQVTACGAQVDREQFLSALLSINERGKALPHEAIIHAAHSAFKFISLFSRDDGATITKQAYQQLMGLFNSVFVVLQSGNPNQRFHQLFTNQFMTEMVTAYIFNVLFAAQVQGASRQLHQSGFQLIASKTQQDVSALINSQRRLSVDEHHGYLFYLILGLHVVLSAENDGDTGASSVVHSFFNAIIQNEYKVGRSFFKQLLKQIIPMAFVRVIRDLQKPVSIQYFVNNHGYVEKIGGSEQDNELLQDQLHVLRMIYSIDKGQFQGLLQSMIQQVIGGLDIFLLQQLSIAYPVIYELDAKHAEDIIFMVLSFKSLLERNAGLNTAEQLCVTTQYILYMISCSTSLLSRCCFNVQIVNQCLFQITSAQVIPQLQEQAFTTLIQCLTTKFQAGDQMQFKSFLKKEVIDHVFTISSQCLNQFQIEEIYSVLLGLIPEESERILAPVQQHFHEQLTQIQERGQVDEQAQRGLVQMVQILISIVQSAGSNAVSQELKDDVFNTAKLCQRCTNEVLNSKLNQVLALLSLQSEEMEQLIDSANERLAALIAGDNSISDSDMSYLCLVYGLVRSPAGDGKQRHSTLLIGILNQLIMYQVRGGVNTVNQDVNKYIYQIFEVYLGGHCQLYASAVAGDAGLRTTFLSCFVTAACNFQFDQLQFGRLYGRYRTDIVSLVLRRAGPEFLSFVLRNIAENIQTVVCEPLVRDAVSLSVRVNGVQGASEQMGGVDPGIVGGCADDDPKVRSESLHDLRVVLEARTRQW